MGRGYNKNVYHCFTVIYISTIVAAGVFIGLFFILNGSSFTFNRKLPDVSIKAYSIALLISTVIGLSFALKIRTIHSRKFILETCGFIWCGLAALIIVFFMPYYEEALWSVVALAIQISVFLALILGIVEHDEYSVPEISDEEPEGFKLSPKEIKFLRKNFIKNLDTEEIKENEIQNVEKT